jgi:hypothetical protein
MGAVNHPFMQKKLGYLVREIGLLRVVEVGNQTSTAEITVSCDTVEFGDLLKPYEAYTGPKEGITKTPRDKIVNRRSREYNSDRFRGGEYSIQGTRVPLEEVMHDRPQIPRKVLGELVVLKVEKGASVALITRTTAEVQIGDMIERSN